MTEEIKYCEDCRHYKPDLVFSDWRPQTEHSRCANPHVDARNRIARGFGAVFCSVERQDRGGSTTCGPGARRFEQGAPRAIPGSVTLMRGNPHDRGGWVSRFWNWLT